MKRLLKALLGFNAASLVHLIRLRPKQFLHASRRAFAVARDLPMEISQIPQKTLGEILGDRQPAIRLSVMQYDPGMLPSEQAMAVLSILVAEAPAEVLEIGT